MGSVEGALWLASQIPNILCYWPPSNSEKWLPGLHPWQVKKLSKYIFCGAYYLTVLVYSKTTIYLCVGGCSRVIQWIPRQNLSSCQGKKHIHKGGSRDKIT